MTLVDGRDHLEDDRLKRHLEDGRCHLHLGQRREIESKVAPFLKDRQKHADEAAEEYKLAKDEFKAVIKKYNEIDKTKLSPRENSDNLINLSLAYHELGYIYFIEKSYLSAEENCKISIRTLNLIPEPEAKRLKDDNQFPISWFLNDLGYLYYEWENTMRQ